MADPEKSKMDPSFSMFDAPNKLDKEYAKIQRELKDQLDNNAEIQEAQKIYGNDRIPEYWQHKQTGEIVRVTKYMYVIGGGRRVAFTNPAWGYETSASLDEFQTEYTVYSNQQTTRA